LSGNGKQVREMGETLLCAVRFAHAHAEEYGGNPDRVILVGFSAGAWMGAQVALAGETLETRWAALAESAGEPPRQVGCTAPDGSPDVDAFVGIAGPYAAFENAPGIDPDLRKVVEISAYVGERPDLRVRLLHGRTDGVVKPSASEDFLALLVDAGYDAQLTLFDEGHKVPHELVLSAVAELGQ
jgi:predicted esterase